MAVLMKHVATYQKTKPAYDAYRRAKDKGAYRAKQESSLILHEAAAKTLKASGITKLPNLAAMQEEYRTAPSAERSPLRRLWKVEKESQGIRCYQTEHRQHFAARERAGTWKGNRARIKSIYGISHKKRGRR